MRQSCSLASERSMHKRLFPRPPGKRSWRCFSTKHPVPFRKHLPASIAKTAAGPLLADSPLRGLVSFASDLQVHSGELEIFDDGPVLLKAGDESKEEEVTIFVEKDDLQGDENVVELSFNITHQGVSEPLPFIPRVSLLMRRDDSGSGNWTRSLRSWGFRWGTLLSSIR